jgi:hypothetical protein
MTPEMTEGVTIHYAKQIEDVLAVALPLLAAKPQPQPLRPNAETAVSATA